MWCLPTDLLSGGSSCGVTQWDPLTYVVVSLVLAEYIYIYVCMYIDTYIHYRMDLLYPLTYVVVSLVLAEYQRGGAMHKLMS